MADYPDNYPDDLTKAVEGGYSYRHMSILAGADGLPLAAGSLGGGSFWGTVSFMASAAAYLALDIMDVAKEITFYSRGGVTPVPVGSVLRVTTAIVAIDVASVPAGQTSFVGRMYGLTPPSALADNAAWTLASADLSTYRGPIPLGTPVDEGAALYVKTPYVDFDVQLEANKSSLFMQLQTTGAHTATAVARQVTLLGVVL